MSNRYNLGTVLLVFLFVGFTAAQAQDTSQRRGLTRAQQSGARGSIPELGRSAPDSISFQGYLTDDLGAPLNQTVSITTKFYKQGVAGYTQTHTGVEVEDGIFNLVIGPVDTVYFDQPIDLGITVGGDTEMTPRTPLQSVPFALGVRGFRAREVVAGDDSSYNVIVGPGINSVDPTNSGQTISGGGGVELGFLVPNVVTDDWGTIGGGNDNQVLDDWGTIGGGVSNTVVQEAGTVAGGESNRTTGGWATIGGGFDNTASGIDAFVGGGSENEAGGDAAAIPGGRGNFAAELAFASGCIGWAEHQGSFVWSGSTALGCGDTLRTSAVGQFIVRAPGGITMFTNLAATTGPTVAAGSGAWAPLSDVNAKTGFDDADPRDVLERLSRIPIRTWRYKAQEEHIRHMGPTAQDFYNEFGLGNDDKHIVTVDADGVTMAAIQGLYELVKDQQAEIDRLRALVEAGD